MTDLFTLGLEIMHLCVEHYGLPKTLLGIAFFISLFIILWQLPELIIAWKS